MSFCGILDGFEYNILENGCDGPVFLWGMYPHQGNEIEHTWECAVQKSGAKNFVLASYKVNDWNRDMSVWKAPAVFGNNDFSGGGPDTLEWLKKQFVPFLKEKFGPDRKIYTTGYSLSGLFALWAAYETELFDGAVCCSGSLWYPEWDTYVSEKSLKKKSDIYLSLGTKEEKTRNSIMATVGDRTRNQAEILKNDPFAANVILEWNQGGHFADSEERIAKGIEWILNLNKKI